MEPERKCVECGAAMAYWRGRPALRCGECARGRRRIKQRDPVVCIDCGESFAPPGQTGRPPVRCRPCNTIQLRKLNAKAMRNWRAKNPDKWQEISRRAHKKRVTAPDYSKRRHDHGLKTKYGLSPDEFALILDSQGEKCAICGGGPKGWGGSNGPRLHVDHCHTTNRIRGLLCSNCNTMLGLAGDDPARLLAAAEYLRKT